MKKVAIYQNTISPGGRIRVIAPITKCLNNLGIVPDWISFRNSFKKEDLKTIHSVPLDVNIKIIDSWSKGLGEYKYIKLNKIISRMSNNYDLIINSNNTISGIKEGDNFLHFIYFPREARVLPEFSNSVYSSSFANLFFKLLFNYSSKPKLSKGFMGISNFTISAINSAYKIPTEEIELAYPPVNVELKDPLEFEGKKNSVISIGRFDENKDQQSQILIAKHNPNLKFYLCGFTPNKSSELYFESCEAMIKKENLLNIKLFRNVANEELIKRLNESKFFLHTMKDEPFGLVTVEAIIHGCIPLVHSSGGSREIVRMSELMFDNVVDASKKLNILSQIGPNRARELINGLFKKVAEFDEKKFKKKMTQKLESILS